jgi:hypothetical protein
MKVDFKEGKERIVVMLEQFMYDFKVDMGEDIKIIINRNEENAIEEIEEIIESIRINECYTEEAIAQLEKACSLKDILLAMRNTVYEEEEAAILKEFFGIDYITIS